MSAASQIIAALQGAGIAVHAATSPVTQGMILSVSGHSLPLRLYAWQVTDNGIATGIVRPADERRIQAIASKGHLIDAAANPETVVLGWCDEFAPEPLIVAFNPYGVARRVNGKIQRKLAGGAAEARASDSQQFRQSLLDDAVINGIAVGTNQHGEHVVAMKPARFLDYLTKYKPTYQPSTATGTTGAPPIVTTGTPPVTTGTPAAATTGTPTAAAATAAAGTPAAGTAGTPSGAGTSMTDLVAEAELEEAAPVDPAESGVPPMFDPSMIEDGRERVAREIAIRRGQVIFRRSLLDSYGCCAMTGCSVEAAIEGAHIVPYQGPGTNHVTNGLLLRGDVHTLFDLGLLAVDSDTLTILVAPQLNGTDYESLRGQPLRIGKSSTSPSKEALQVHRKLAGI